MCGDCSPVSYTHLDVYKRQISGSKRQKLHLWRKRDIQKRCEHQAHRKAMCIRDRYKRSLQAAKKGRVLIFHWRGGYLTKEVLKELLELIRKAGDEKDKTAMVSINWPQAVIRVQYTDMQVQESVTIEEANEGEKE